MPETIRCVECGTTVLGVQIADSDPEPIGSDDCSVCGGTTFETERSE